MHLQTQNTRIATILNKVCKDCPSSTLKLQTISHMTILSLHHPFHFIVARYKQTCKLSLSCVLQWEPNSLSLYRSGQMQPHSIFLVQSISWDANCSFTAYPSSLRKFSSICNRISQSSKYCPWLHNREEATQSPAIQPNPNTQQARKLFYHTSMAVQKLAFCTSYT